MKRFLNDGLLFALSYPLLRKLFIKRMNSVPFKIIIPVQNDVSTFPNFEVFQMDPSYTIYGMLLEQKLTLSLQPSNAYSFT